MKKIIQLVFVLFTYTFSLSSFAQVEEKSKVSILLGEKIPMRDGINLDATIYKPKHINKQLPVVVYLTPYVTDHATKQGFHMAENNFVFIAVNSRGRGDSEGKFVALENEGRDGHDIIEWAAEQTWSSGKVGMLGGSYAGYVQWTTLKEFPKGLVSMLPIASVGPGLDFPMYKNIAYPYSLRWLTFTEGKTSRLELFKSYENFWKEAELDLYKSQLPLPYYSSKTGIKNPLYDKWLSHNTFDDYWKSMHPTSSDYNNIDIPILSITGFYDGDYPGAMNYYNQHMNHGNRSAIKNHFLIMGPWDHSQTRRPKSEIGGLKTGDKGVLEMFDLYVDWFNWTLRDGEKPKILKDRVAYYVIGKNDWFYANKYQAFKEPSTKLYFSHTENPSSVFNSGLLLTQKSNRHQIAKFESNPLINKEPIPTKDDYLFDQTDVMLINGDGLVYHTVPFVENTILSGEIKASIALSLSAADADLEVKVSEITATGESIYLARDRTRIRFRDSLEKESVLPIGEIANVDFHDFFFHGKLLKKGSRLRVTIRPINAPNTQRNFQTGGDLNKESGQNAKKAIIYIHNDDQHNSFISFPLVTEKDFDKKSKVK
jgi:putative CocE/NonD family hydrolase